MKELNKRAAYMLVSVLAIGLAPKLSADVLYKYVGNQLIDEQIEPPFGLCVPVNTTACFIQGSFTVANALDGNLHNAQVVPESFNFKILTAFPPLGSGLNEGNTLAPGGVHIFDISTDANGQIVAWNIILEDSFGSSDMRITTNGDSALADTTTLGARNQTRQAVQARADPDFLIIARTDAVAVEGLDRAIDRAAQYRRAGADMLFIEAVRTEEEAATVARAFPGVPLLFNWAEGGKTPPIA